MPVDDIPCAQGGLETRRCTNLDRDSLPLVQSVAHTVRDSSSLSMLLSIIKGIANLCNAGNLMTLRACWVSRDSTPGLLGSLEECNPRSPPPSHTDTRSFMFAQAAAALCKFKVYSILVFCQQFCQIMPVPPHAVPRQNSLVHRVWHPHDIRH